MSALFLTSLKKNATIINNYSQTTLACRPTSNYNVSKEVIH